MTRWIKWILGSSTLLLATNVVADDAYKIYAQLLNLAMFSQQSSTDDHTTNGAALVVGGEWKLNNDLDEFGILKAQYTFNFLNRDAQLNTSTNWFGGVGSYVGGAIALNDIASSQLSLLTWENTWLDNTLFTSVGRTNLRRYFLFNNCQNIALCTDPIKLSMGSLPTNYGYLGGYAKYALSDQFYVHTGIFEVNTDDYIHKKKGLDFSLHHELGYTQVYGIGYKHNQNKVEALYFYNNSEYNNILTKSLYSGTDGINIRFNYAFQKLNQPEIYGAFSKIFQANQAYSYYWELGINQKLNDRGDRLGIKIGQSQLNDDFYRFTQTLQGNQNQTTTFLSIDTAFKFKGFSLSPFVQYVWNPDNYYRANQNGFNHNLILGLLTQITIY